MSPALLSRAVTASDVPAIAALHAQVFGPGRFARSAYRVREGKGKSAFSRFCRLIENGGDIIAAVRITPITIGNECGAVLLGPIAVRSGYTGQGLGSRLIGEALDDMRAAGIALVVLVGDEPYYGRLGFKAVPAGQIVLPGPANPARILACELQAGCLTRYRGAICAAPSADAGRG